MPVFGRTVTIAQPAVSTALVTRAAIKAELDVGGTADDAYIDALIAQASAACARYCNRVFAIEMVLERIWPARDPYPWQVPAAPGPVQLCRWPVVTLVSLVADDIAMEDGAAFALDAERGQLIRLDHRGLPTTWRAAVIAATYQAGYATIPPDLADAATRMIKARWFARRRDPGVRSETIPGVFEASYWFASGPGASGGLPPDVTGLLDRFRVPVIA